MKIVWNYVVVGLLTIAAATVVIGGEPASAELRLAEAATAVGETLGGALPSSEPASSTLD